MPDGFVSEWYQFASILWAPDVEQFSCVFKELLWSFLEILQQSCLAARTGIMGSEIAWCKVNSFQRVAPLTSPWCHGWSKGFRPESKNSNQTGLRSSPVNGPEPSMDKPCRQNQHSVIVADPARQYHPYMPLICVFQNDSGGQLDSEHVHIEHERIFI